MPYSKARKLGSRAYHAAIPRGENPYLPALDEILPDRLSLAHVNLGLITIPVDRIVGTVSRGRTHAFANNFMPLLDDSTEFAIKWMQLHRSVVADGIRTPIKVLEYMNKYYAIEGNKRISVTKFLDSPLMEANVTRVIPKRTDEKENKIYFEYLDFYRDTGINSIWFSEEGSFVKLCELADKEPGQTWSEDERAELSTAFLRFSAAYNLIGGDLLNLTVGDAFLIYLQVFGYDKDSFVVSSQLRANLNRLRNEFRTRDQDESFSLLMDSGEQSSGLGLLQQFISSTQRMKVAFINNRSPETSGWTYWHNLGKNRIDSVFGDRIESRMISNVAPESCEAVIEDLLEDDFGIIFTTSPVLLDGAIKAALRHPDAKILNCSLLPSYHAVRSYYLRIYEAKFIIGAIAGAVCDNNRIGYIADYPVYGVPASINAFALGARLTNPRAKVYLEWSSIRDHDPLEGLAANNVNVISNRDISAPSHQSMNFGLYTTDGSESRNLAMPVWNWGRLYENLLRRVQNGAWRADAANNNLQALNYWWGMDSDAIDVFYSHRLDTGTRRMTDLLRRQIRAGALRPFAESILSQDGVQRCAPGQALTPADIISMDWLADNVVGIIPTAADMRPEALPFVEQQGIHSIKAPDISEICWTDSKDGE